MEQHLFWQCVAMPACCAAAALLALDRHRVAWMGCVLAVTFLLSVVTQQGGWAWPAPGEWTWMAVALASASLVAASGGCCRSTRSTRGATCALAATMAALLLPLPGWNDATSRLGLAVAGAAMATLLLPLGMHRGGFSSWLCWSLSLAAPSVVALSCGFAKLAVSIAAVSAACGAIGSLVVATRRRLHAELSGSIVVALVSVLGSASAHAFDSLDTPRWVFVVAAMAPLGAWLGEAPPFRGTALVSALARVTGVIAIAGAAVWAVAPRLASDGQPDAYAARVERSTTNPPELSDH